MTTSNNYEVRAVAHGRCRALVGNNLTPCDVRLADHTHLRHTFLPRLHLRTHFLWSGTERMLCGRPKAEEYVHINRSSENIVQELAAANAVCISCLKQWFYISNRIQFLREALSK